MEIQRLIGRSLRSVIDMDALGERSVILDCDVLQADGGTRTAAITGAYIALSAALRQLVKFGALKKSPIRDFVAATSVGIIGGTPMLDLCYQEDSQAEVDMNVVMTGAGTIRRTASHRGEDCFRRRAAGRLLALARQGIGELVAIQKTVRRHDAVTVYCATSQSRESCGSFSWPRPISTCSRFPPRRRRRMKPATRSKRTPSTRRAYYGGFIGRISVRRRLRPGSRRAGRRARACIRRATRVRKRPTPTTTRCCSNACAASRTGRRDSSA